MKCAVPDASRIALPIERCMKQPDDRYTPFIVLAKVWRRTKDAAFSCRGLALEVSLSDIGSKLASPVSSASLFVARGSNLGLKGAVSDGRAKGLKVRAAFVTALLRVIGDATSLI